jgi:hypothetical protein
MGSASHEYALFPRQSPGRKRRLADTWPPRTSGGSPTGLRLFQLWLAVNRQEQRRRLQAQGRLAQAV